MGAGGVPNRTIVRIDENVGVYQHEALNQTLDMICMWMEN